MAHEFVLKCHRAVHEETIVNEVAVAEEVALVVVVVVPAVGAAIVTGMLNFVSVESILSHN